MSTGDRAEEGSTSGSDAAPAGGGGEGALSDGCAGEWVLREGLGLVEQVLLRAREQGFLGPGPVEAHLSHALAFAAVATAASSGGAGEAGPSSVLDLGSGAGVPGLVLALRWPEARLVLLDAGGRRIAFLDQAVAEMGLAPRVEVVRVRAEEAARDERWRQTFAVVVARGFGPPPVTAECGGPLVRVGGVLVVSEPPASAGEAGEAGGDSDDDGSPRWQPRALAQLGLVPRPRVEDSGFSFRVLDKTAPGSPRFPRRTGIPAKRPLF